MAKTGDNSNKAMIDGPNAALADHFALHEWQDQAARPVWFMRQEMRQENRRRERI